MNAMIDSSSIDPVEAARIEEDTSASLVTTLYDLIAAIQEVVGADDAIVVATVRHILGSGRAILRGNLAQCTS